MAHHGHDNDGAATALAVMDAVGLSEMLLMGYSMGGYISMSLLMKHPERIPKVIIAGVGASYLDINAAGGARGRSRAAARAIAHALLKLLTRPPSPIRIGRRTSAPSPIRPVRTAVSALAALHARLTATPISRAQLRRNPSAPSSWSAARQMTISLGPPGPLAAAFADGRAVADAQAGPHDGGGGQGL